MKSVVATLFGILTVIACTAQSHAVECRVATIKSGADRTQITDTVRKAIMEQSLEIRRFIADSPTQCSVSETYNASVIQKLLAASKLSPSAYPGVDIISTIGCFYPDSMNIGLHSTHIQASATWLLKANSEDEYAGIMAHELSHFVLGHEEESLDWIFNIGLNDHWNEYYIDVRRRQERDADLYGMQLLVNAGYDPYAMPKAFRHFFRLTHSPLDGGSVEHGINRDRINEMGLQIHACNYVSRSRTPISRAAVKELKRLHRSSR